MECDVKWALGGIITNKTNRGEGISAELFKILKDDAVGSETFNMSANLENSAVAIGLKKVDFHSSPN